MITAWLSGAARCLDLFGVFDLGHEGITDDLDAIHIDWEKVGDDFRSVVR